MASFRYIFLLCLSVSALEQPGCLDEHCEAEKSVSWVQMKVERQMRSGKSSPKSYFWSRRGRDASTSNNIDFQVPKDFSREPTWVFDNVGDEQVRHSPLIDDEKNVYIMTTTKLRKFTQKGSLLWTFQQDLPMTTSPTMQDNVIYLLAGSTRGTLKVYALNMSDASLLWKQSFPGRVTGPDSHGLLLVKDHLILPFMENAPGDNAFMAVNASNGKHLWDYVTDEVVWNSSPSAMEDSIIFSSTCGAVFRIDLKGKLMWKSGTQRGGVTMCGTGGGSLGSNGIFYAEWNKEPSGGTTGHLSAFNATNGEKIWQRDFDDTHQGMQYPAVGKLGPNGPLAVVAALGHNPGMPQHLLLTGSKEEQDRYFTDAKYRKSLGVVPVPNFVLAMNAETGETIWEWKEEPWDHFGSAGDEEGFAMRMAKHNIENPMCLPDLQGIPVVNSWDGSVFASSGHGGNLTVIKDHNQNGIIEDNEVTGFAPGVCFLNSPSMAPGMLVASPCWGPTYVWLQ